MKKITKAIIPAAGLGTRFLPATKAMPKEMLPILDKPTIQYIVEEAAKAGIEDIIIVTGNTNGRSKIISITKKNSRSRSRTPERRNYSRRFNSRRTSRTSSMSAKKNKKVSVTPF